MAIVTSRETLLDNRLENIIFIIFLSVIKLNLPISIKYQKPLFSIVLWSSLVAEIKVQKKALALRSGICPLFPNFALQDIMF